MNPYVTNDPYAAYRYRQPQADPWAAYRYRQQQTATVDPRVAAWQRYYQMYSPRGAQSSAYNVDDPRLLGPQQRPGWNPQPVEEPQGPDAFSNQGADAGAAGGMNLQDILNQAANLKNQPENPMGTPDAAAGQPAPSKSGRLLGLVKYLAIGAAGLLLGKLFGGKGKGDTAQDGRINPETSRFVTKDDPKQPTYGIYKPEDANNEKAEPSSYVKFDPDKLKLIEVPANALELIEAPAEESNPEPPASSEKTEQPENTEPQKEKPEASSK